MSDIEVEIDLRKNKTDLASNHSKNKQDKTKGNSRFTLQVETPTTQNSKQVFAAHKRDFEPVKDDHPASQILTWEDFESIARADGSYFVVARNYDSDGVVGYALVCRDLSSAYCVSESFFAATQSEFYPDRLHYVALLGIEQKAPLAVFRKIVVKIWDIVAAEESKVIIDTRDVSSAQRIPELIGRWNYDDGAEVQLLGSQQFWLLDPKSRTAGESDRVRDLKSVEG